MPEGHPDDRKNQSQNETQRQAQGGDLYGYQKSAKEVGKSDDKKLEIEEIVEQITEVHDSGIAHFLQNSFLRTASPEEGTAGS